MAAADATTTLRVGSFVFSNDYRNPVLLAKEIATIDVISGGRVDLGIGAGWRTSDYREMGLSYDAPAVRVSRLEESVHLLKLLLSQESPATLGRMISGPPRIAALFRDLNPPQSLQGVLVFAEASRVVVTWAAVPDFEGTFSQTFQVRLYADGRVEIAYNGVATSAAVVGISPGGDQGSATLVSFAGDTSAEYAGTIAERFTTTAEVDVFATAKRFYQTHEDAYDYLVIYNYAGILAAPSALAYEMTARNVNRAGYGDTPADTGLPQHARWVPGYAPKGSND